MDAKASLRSVMAGALCCGLAVGPAWATPLPRYGMFVFSSLCRDRMTDDLNGDRLVLVRLPFHDFGYMEGGDGGFTSAPLENLSVERGTIAFSYRDEGEADKSKAVKNVRSTISAESVELISWDRKPFRLMRQWKLNGQIPACPEK